MEAEMQASEKHLKKESSSHGTDQMDDIGPLSSAHNIGFLLSKYENFMDKKDIISPSKIIDQKQRILDNIDDSLLTIFGDFLEISEKSHESINPDAEDWQLMFKEEYSNKDFKVFLSKKSSTQGKFLMAFEGLQAENLSKEFMEPDRRSLWDPLLASRKYIYKKSTKEMDVIDIYKPCELLNKYKEIEYLRYHNKLKHSWFLLGKSLKQQMKKHDFEENKKNMKNEEKIQGILNKLIAIVFNFSKNQKNYAGVYYAIDIFFDVNADGVIDNDLNKKLLYDFLQNFKNFHALIAPKSVLLKSPYHSPLFKNKEILMLNSKKQPLFPPNTVNCNEIDIILKKPDTSSLILKRKKSMPIFNKGNAEVYPSKADLEIFYKYYHNNYHVLECIQNYHQLTITEDCEVLIETNDSQGHFAYKKDYARGKKGGLNYLNSDLMIEQKKVILSLLKQAGSNLIHGRGLINITLPVEIFEPRSFLERLARSFGHAPIFLEKAGETEDIIEQMKLTIAFFLSSMVLCIQQEKPFNPILGETFQGRINGCPIYLEQLKHHPPITYYYMMGKNFRLYGSHEPVANLSANTCVAEQKGSPVAEFLNNGTKIYFRWPLFIINGTVMGQRSFNFFSKAIAYEKKNNYVCEVLFNVNEVGGFKGLFNRKEYFIDEIGGGIYKVKPDVINRYENAKKPFKVELSHENDVVQTIAKINGEWTSNVEFDGVKYWDIEKHRPFLLEYEPYCLPSDCNYRDDVLFLRMGRRDEAQIKKNEGENSQRYDKKLRNKFKKAHKNKK